MNWLYWSKNGLEGKHEWMSKKGCTDPAVLSGHNQCVPSPVFRRRSPGKNLFRYQQATWHAICEKGQDSSQQLHERGAKLLYFLHHQLSGALCIVVLQWLHTETP